MRVDNNSNKLIINKLCIIILESIKSMILDYAFLYSDKELDALKNMLDKISTFQTLDTINLVEEELKELAFRTWEYEEKQGNHFIHWLKNDVIKQNQTDTTENFTTVRDYLCADWGGTIAEGLQRGYLI